MPKLKTKKSVAKRFKVTRSGKVKLAKSNHRHILTTKTRKQKRQTKRSTYLSDADEARIKMMLPYA